MQIYKFFNSSNKEHVSSTLLQREFNLLRKFIVDHDKKNFNQIFQKIYQNSTIFFKKFQNFLRIKGTENSTFLFFDIYCDIVENKLDSIKADRTRNFQLHLTSCRQISLNFSSMNHHLYAKGILLYLIGTEGRPRSQ